MTKNKFFNYGTEDYREKRVESIALKELKTVNKDTYFELEIKTPNSTQTINLSENQLKQLREQIK